MIYGFDIRIAYLLATGVSLSRSGVHFLLVLDEKETDELSHMKAP